MINQFKTSKIIFFAFLALAFVSPQISQAICRPQCTDYVNQILGLNHHVGSAVNWWNSSPAGYKKRENGSKDKPSKNDIIVWRNVGGGNGHVAIVKDVDNGVVTIKDSNWNKNWETDCKERTRSLNYKKDRKRYYIQDSNVIGWLSK